MRVARLLLLLLVPTAARADAPKELNLLIWAPATIAVSSTVDNAAIAPEHMVDGKLDTAWNSRTGDVDHAWIAFRVPAGAHVSKIKLTAGFAKGDYFTQNYRIDRVRIMHDDKDLGLRALDRDNRGLQELAVDATGGDFTIEIANVTPGSKPSWKEIAISELEVWGTVADPVPSKPTIRIGSLDVDCPHMLFPKLKVNKIGDADFVLTTSSTKLGANLVACNVRHGDAKNETASVDLAFVALGPKPKIVARVDSTLVYNQTPTEYEMTATQYGDLEVAAFPLTGSETAYLVETHESTNGPMMHVATRTSHLYRLGKSGLEGVLEFTSHWNDGESDDDTVCTLAVGKPRKPLPDLDLTCVQVEGRWHGEDPRGNGRYETPSTEHYRWKAGSYVKL